MSLTWSVSSPPAGRFMLSVSPALQCCYVEKRWQIYGIGQRQFKSGDLGGDAIARANIQGGIWLLAQSAAKRQH